MTMHVIDAKTADAWLRQGDAVLIDVREADEFAAEHIPAALSLPLSQLAAHLSAVPQGKKRLFHCQKGKRGEQACAIVDGEKWNIDGGIEAWKTAGLPVIGKQNATALPLIRQVQLTVGSLIVLAVLAGFAGWHGAFVLAGLFGAGLAFAGATGWCGMAMLLAKMPWNRGAACRAK